MAATCVGSCFSLKVKGGGGGGGGGYCGPLSMNVTAETFGVDNWDASICYLIGWKQVDSFWF